MNQAVFLDRDGVINRALIMDGKPYPPGSLSELEILPGVADALARLRAAGFRLVVVTNQPDVARGTQSRANVEAMHDWLGARLALDEFRVCYHDDAARCACRKPEPGAILAAAEKNRLDLRASFLVGDRWRDIEAGRRAGCRTIYVDRHYHERRAEGFDARVESLAEAAAWILNTGHETNR